MSMISSQIDELRKMAGKLESYDQGYGTICQALRDAADTIWQLRDDLQRANAENAKLREQVADACMQLGGAWVRCTELRELVRFIMHQCNDGNPRCDECIGWNDGECVALQRMRELGVEVE